MKHNPQQPIIQAFTNLIGGLKRKYLNHLPEQRTPSGRSPGGARVTGVARFRGGVMEEISRSPETMGEGTFEGGESSRKGVKASQYLSLRFHPRKFAEQIPGAISLYNFRRKQ